MKYSKAIVAALTAVIAVLITVAEDGKISGHEWWLVAETIVGAISVWLIPNKSDEVIGENYYK